VSADKLIGNLYEAALRTDSFLEVFHEVAETLGGNVFHMFSWDTARNAPQFSIYSPRAEFDDVIARYEQYYGALDPRRNFVAQAPLGEFVCCHDYLTDADVARSEFFQDFQIPAGFRYLMGVRLSQPGSDDILLGLLRAHGRTPYSSDDRAAAARTVDHLARAITLWRDAQVLRRDAALGAELMQEQGLAVFALDRQARVVSVNRIAETMLRATACVKLEHGRLCASVAAENDALKAALARVQKTRQGESLALRNAPHAAHEIFLNISALPDRTMHGAFGDAAILITARRRGERPLVVAQQLRHTFGMSNAEAAVAEALLGGKTPDECAASAGVSVATIRTQLRAIYEKTQTRSQAEAVSRMLWVLPRSRRED